MSSFATAKDAKEFLLERVRARSEREGQALTELEECALRFSVEDEEIDEERQAAFEREYELAEFEKRMGGLLARALQDDRESRPDLAELWEDAYQTLRRGDHYLLIILKPVMRPGWLRRLRGAFRG